VKESVTEKRDQVMDQLRGTGSKLGDAAPDTEQVKEGAQRAVGVAQENPLGLALAGVAGGFLVGMMLPSSRIENERVGPLADQVKETAAETGQEALDRGKEVASQVAEQAVEGAKEAGQEALDTAKEAGREQAEELKSSAEESAQEVKEKARS
jgi:gas vesicle protein